MHLQYGLPGGMFQIQGTLLRFLWLSSYYLSLVGETRKSVMFGGGQDTVELNDRRP